MTANHTHTLKTAQVRFAATFPNEKFSLKGTDFDRWLAARDARIIAAAEQRGAERVLREVADHMHENTSVIIDRDKYTACSSCTSIYRQYFNDRADQMEGDE